MRFYETQCYFVFSRAHIFDANDKNVDNDTLCLCAINGTIATPYN